ncbi:NAD-dependent epimerase/dehydratase family protein [Desulfopila sp. IMCC35006]|uniref:NAD-dependent epimerase/dehydratase family protein n=1 Tax=Desulfopila sp. IMCC35006 TaxID=2569542 RepID=UPI0010AD9F9D|nr:NAD-dependent epimerase/dehydratase family protein [Desulfopila sp. IMCC35006]TKB26118.1 NAD-dependent epimerase/dehydratase family protein [Desulfopila sp. IMCC35006]
MRLLVTGATGYIGERLVRHALSQGHEIIAASRRRPNEDIEWIPFDLSAASEIILPEGIDSVFHLAATTISHDIDPDIEMEAAKHLIKAAVQANAKIIFISSQTARKDAPTVYGRTKWQIEKLVLAAAGLVVRPGQVYGGPERALFGELLRSVRRLPVIPAFLPAPKVQPVHIDDLIVALLHCAESNSIPSSILHIGATQPVSFTKFLRTISIVRVRGYRPPIPLPIALVRFAGLISGKRLRITLGIDRLSSLSDLPTMQTDHDLQLLGVTLRPLSSGMTRSGNERRRILIREGQALLQYVLKVRPTPALIRRYVRSIELIRDGESLNLPEFLLVAPMAIALLDHTPAQSTSYEEEFTWRLNTAVVLAEASVQGAKRFLGIGEYNGFVICLGRMTRAVILELCWRILRLIACPFWGILFRNSRLSK